MTDKLADSYQMPTEESENNSLSSDTQTGENPPFQNITEDDIFEHSIDDALSQEGKDADYDEDNLPEREYIEMPTIFEPIPEEAQKEILSKFALRKREQESSVIKTAQKLVNQFRALSAFRDDYVVEYNEELLNAPEEVISFLPTIIGGPSVREYLDYILAHKQQGKVFDQDNIDFSITKRQGYLPSPDEDESYPTLQKENISGNVTIDHTPFIQQTQILSDTLNSLKDTLTEQSTVLKSAISMMGESLNRPLQVNSDIPIAVQTSENSELTAQTLQMQREMMENAFGKMVSMQSELFQKTVEELSKTVQTMQEQLRPAGVVRQALSSLKAAQTPSKEDAVSQEMSTTIKEKKQNKRQSKKEEMIPLQSENIVPVDIETPSSVYVNEEKNDIKNTEQEVFSAVTAPSPLPLKETSEVENLTPENEIKPKQEKKFSLLDELGITDDFDTYDEIHKNKRYSLLDELENDEMEILSEFDISKND